VTCVREVEGTRKLGMEDTICNTKQTRRVATFECYWLYPMDTGMPYLVISWQCVCKKKNMRNCVLAIEF